MAARIEELVEKMERARAKLNTALDEIAPQTEIVPTWKVKQVMDHIAGWDVLVSTTLQAYKNQEAPPLMKEEGIDRFNAASVTARKDISYEQSRQEFDAARAEVIGVMRQLPPEMLTQQYPAPWGGKCTISSIVRIFVSHEQEHAEQIEDVLGDPNRIS